MSYSQLTLQQRYHISAFRKLGYRQKEIAEELGVSPSTISRELRRNRNLDGHYDPEYAASEARLRQQRKRKYTVWTPGVERYVRAKLKLEWSPEQIAGRMKKERGWSLSHETIYRFIYRNKANGGKLYRSLRHKSRKYHRRTSEKDNRGKIPQRVGIEERPKIVEKKSRVGDWEIDTVIGKGHQGVLVTVVDRKSKFALIGHSKSKEAQEVTDVTLRLLMPLKALAHTITSDNGKEFAKHTTIAKELEADFYFANPYHSWERGLNEHTNGLIRQYLPKERELLSVTKRELTMIQDRLNHRPRKALGFKTPYEVFFGEFLKKVAA
jgi:IS30 family transposase